jgi:hypothetical protein
MLIGLSFFANACTNDNNQTITDEIVQEKRIGVLKSLGGISVGEGTHLLELNDGTTLRLRSNNINLDSEKYLSKKVEVRGPISTTEDGKQLMNVVSIDIAEDDEELAENIANEEKEYVNANIGFKLKYLNTWQIEENEEEIIFKAPKTQEENNEQDMVIISKIANPSKKSLEAFLNLPSDPNDLITLGYTKTNVGIDELDGLKKQSSDLKQIDIYISRDDYIYHLTFKGSDNPNLINNRNRFFTMLSSFQFIALEQEDENTKVTENTSLEESTDTNSNLEENVQETTFESFESKENNENLEKPTETDTAELSNAETESSYGIIAEYIGKTINSIAPEKSESGVWEAYSFEFVDPNYVYVNYTNGTENRRVLLTYDDSGSNIKTNVVGYFEPGETTSWERVSGENPASGKEKVVISVDDSGTKEETVVKEGYSYFESLPYDFKAQYPSNWYYSGSAGSGDVKHHYGFSNEPVENGNELVSIDIISGELPSGSSINLGDKTGVKIYNDDEVIIYIQREDGNLYKIHGDLENENYVINIASSIQED